MTVLMVLFCNDSPNRATAGVDSNWQYIWFGMGLALVCFIVLQIYLLNLGLSRWGAVHELPVFQCT